MGLGPCGSPSGYSIPSASAYEKDIDLHFGDGTSYLGNYIGVLASEYLMLSGNGGSAEQLNRVKEELYYAMKAYERLDKNAEVILDPKAENCFYPANGFFIRDDVGNPSNYFNDHPSPLRPKKNPTDIGVPKTLISDYLGAVNATGCSNSKKDDDPYRYPTVDQFSNLLVGFALVVKCLDDGTSFLEPNGHVYNFKYQAKDYTDRILKYVQYYNYKIPVPHAYDHNGNQCFVFAGKGESQLLAYPLAKAGEAIYKGQLGTEPVFKIQTGQSTVLYEDNIATGITQNIWLNTFSYPTSSYYFESNYRNEGAADILDFIATPSAAFEFITPTQYNNAIFLQLAAVGNSWKVGAIPVPKPGITAPGFCDQCVDLPFDPCAFTATLPCLKQYPVTCYTINADAYITAQITHEILGNFPFQGLLSQLLGALPAGICLPASGLPEFSYNTTAYSISKLSDIGHVPYFGNLHHVIHDKGDYSYSVIDLYNTLQAAPCSGPHYKPYRDIHNPPAGNDWDKPSDDIGVENWRGETRWEKPNPAFEASGNDHAGYNGIDYMIAYNMFHIKHGGEYGLGTFEDKIFRELKNKTYPLSNYLGSKVIPYTEVGYEKIWADHYTVNADASNPSKNGDVDLHAGKSIKLTNFVVKSGAKSKIYIDPLFPCAEVPVLGGRDVQQSPIAQSTESEQKNESKANETLNSKIKVFADSLHSVAQQKQYIPIEKYIASNSTQNEFMSLFPNPIADKGNIKIYTRDQYDTKLRVINSMGEEVNSLDIHLSKGTNDVQFDCSELNVGVYSIIIQTKNSVQTTRFIKK